MHKKLICIMFVITGPGCQPPSEGAVCPSPEEAVAEPEPTPEEVTPVEMTPELEAEIKKAKRRIREEVRRHPW